MAKISRRTALLGLGGAGVAGIGALSFGLANHRKAPAATEPPPPPSPAPSTPTPTPTPTPGFLSLM